MLKENTKDFTSLRSFKLQDWIKNSPVLLRTAYKSKNGVKIGVVNLLAPEFYI
jgi:hypothetical protein